jgi:Flp pilus assembly protein TadG
MEPSVAIVMCRRAAISRLGDYRREQGAAALEFALVVPLLLAFLFGAIQFGFVFAQKASLANGARQAARLGAVAVVPPSRCGDLIMSARDGATTVGMSQPGVRVVYTDASGIKRDVCASVAGSTSVSGNSAVSPCADTSGATSGRLTVETSFQAQIDIPPFGTVGQPKLTGEGTYRCEYR